MFAKHGKHTQGNNGQTWRSDTCNQHDGNKIPFMVTTSRNIHFWNQVDMRQDKI